ncbi:Fc receptor-like protein 2 isoform X2 [Callorhinchus milii]|uniref:Fc receptor-like protein 3 n=1 Tax=Callorhinchus milii TaxID=7868 RepID=A0A4W3K0I8_CALMI|nr:Fc receptor-like protein 2 isoform X2 [Callorhinchus milii]|eukprot:gi/632943367/ref/XP_007886911.1/ PREDICTED: Fc receptor-like protein 3 isoform X2 [Callorhinchus milii]
MWTTICLSSIFLLYHIINTTELKNGATFNKPEIKLTDPKKAEKIALNSRFTLMCSVLIQTIHGQSPKILYSFYKGDAREYLLSNVTSNKEQCNYSVESAKASHSGYYMCAVRIGNETKESGTRYISVTGQLQRPVLKINPTQLVKGDSSNLTCEASYEIPSLKFIFYQNGERLGDKIIKDKQFAVYRLQEVTHDGATNYSCTVESDDSNSKSPKSEMVQIITHVPVSNPVLNFKNSSVVQLGRNATLFCNLSSGTPPINFTLFLQSKSFSTVTSNTQDAVFNVSIIDLARSGEYKCKADNRFSKTGKYSNGINLTVIVPVTTPKLTVNQDSLRITKGQEVILYCHSINGTSPITYDLFLNNICLQSITEHHGNRSTFHVLINETKDIGEYKCKATNLNCKYSNGINFTVEDSQANGSNYNRVLYVLVGIIIITIIIIIVCYITKHHHKKTEPEDISMTHDYYTVQEPESLDATQSVQYTSVVITGSKNDCEGIYSNIRPTNKVRPRRDTEVIYSEIKKPGASADGDSSSSDEDNSVQYIQLDIKALCGEPAQKQESMFI